MQQKATHISRHHPLSSADVTFWENLSAMAANASTELSVPQTASVKYIHKSTEQMYFLTPTLYVGNWDKETSGHLSPSLVLIYNSFEFCD